jgi:hypothetical protein
LVHFAADTHHLVWTWHHVILDAWSVPILLDEMFAAYAALRDSRAPDLPPVRPYRDFIAWQRAQDKAAPEAFWREQLDGMTEPTPLGIGGEVGGDGDRDGGYGLEFLDMPDAEISRLRAAA